MIRALDLAPIDAIDSFAWGKRFEQYLEKGATQARIEPGEPVLLLSEQTCPVLDPLGAGEILGLLELAFGEEAAQQLWCGSLAGRRARWRDVTVTATQAAGGGVVVIVNL